MADSLLMLHRGNNGLTLFRQGAHGLWGNVWSAAVVWPPPPPASLTEFACQHRRHRSETRHPDAVHLARCPLNFEFEGLLRAKDEMAANECREAQTRHVAESLLTEATIITLRPSRGSLFVRGSDKDCLPEL